MDVSEIPDANKGGNCFQVAFELMTELGDSSDALLVHGVCIGRGAIAGIQFVHAWVEMNGFALDDTVGAALPIERFYELGQVSVTHKYTYRQMLEKAIDSGTYGPWEDDLLSDRYASRHMSGVSVPVFSDEWDSTIEGELTRYSCSVGGLYAWILGRYDGYDFYCDSYGLGDRRVVVKRSVTSFCDIPKAMNGNSWDAESDTWKGELMMGRKRAGSRVRAGYDELEEYLRKNRFVTSQDAIDYYIAPALGGYSGDYDLDGIFDAAFEYVDGAYQPIEAIAEESLDGIDDTWLDIVMSNELVTTASRRASGRFAQFENCEGAYVYIGSDRENSGTLMAEIGCDGRDCDFYTGPLPVTSGEIPESFGWGQSIQLTPELMKRYDIDLASDSDDIGWAVLDMLRSYELGHFSSVMARQQVWRCDEDGCKGTFSLDELRDIYDREIEHDDDAPDGAGFSNFEDWLYEMERMGIYVREGGRKRRAMRKRAIFQPLWEENGSGLWMASVNDGCYMTIEQSADMLDIYYEEPYNDSRDVHIDTVLVGSDVDHALLRAQDIATMWWYYNSVDGIYIGNRKAKSMSRRVMRKSASVIHVPGLTRFSHDYGGKYGDGEEYAFIEDGVGMYLTHVETGPAPWGWYIDADDASVVIEDGYGYSTPRDAYDAMKSSVAEAGGNAASMVDLMLSRYASRRPHAGSRKAKNMRHSAGYVNVDDVVQRLWETYGFSESDYLSLSIDSNLGLALGDMGIDMNSMAHGDVEDIKHRIQGHSASRKGNDMNRRATRTKTAFFPSLGDFDIYYDSVSGTPEYRFMDYDYIYSVFPMDESTTLDEFQNRLVECGWDVERADNGDVVLAGEEPCDGIGDAYADMRADVQSNLVESSRATASRMVRRKNVERRGMRRRASFDLSSFVDEGHRAMRKSADVSDSQLDQDLRDINVRLGQITGDWRDVVVERDQFASREVALTVSWATIGATDSQTARKFAQAINEAADFVDSYAHNGERVTYSDTASREGKIMNHKAMRKSAGSIEEGTGASTRPEAIRYFIEPMLGEYADDFDMDAIARDIIVYDSESGLYNVDPSLGDDDIWAIIQRNDLSGHEASMRHSASKHRSARRQALRKH